MLDWSRPLQTRGGRDARLLGKYTSVNLGHRAAVLVAKEDGSERLRSVDSVNGRINPEREYSEDIFNVPEDVVFHANVYANLNEDGPVLYSYATPGTADVARADGADRFILTFGREPDGSLFFKGATRV